MNTNSQGFINKEIIIAITLGFAIGLVVTYGVWTANRSIKERELSISPIPEDNIPANSQTQGQTEQGSITNSNNSLTLLKPASHTLTHDETIIVSGYARPNHTIVILNEGSSYITNSGEEGEFETEINLVNGINYMNIFSISPDGTTDQLSNTLVKTQS